MSNEPAAWTLELICCGRHDGTIDFDTSKAADDYREYYITGAGVNPKGYSGHVYESGHRRAAIKSSPAAVAAGAAGENARTSIDARWYDLAYLWTRRAARLALKAHPELAR